MGSASTGTSGRNDPGDSNAEDIAREYAVRIRARLCSPRVKEIRLFGSRARGDAREDSDYDVLLVLDLRSPELRSEILPKSRIRLWDSGVECVSS